MSVRTAAHVLRLRHLLAAISLFSYCAKPKLPDSKAVLPDLLQTAIYFALYHDLRIIMPFAAGVSSILDVSLPHGSP